MLRGDFMRDLRDDDHKQFFDLNDVEPCSVKGIEQNFGFVLEVVATLAPEPVWMAHTGWKAGDIPRQEKPRELNILVFLVFLLWLGSGCLQNTCRPIWHLSAQDPQESDQGPVITLHWWHLFCPRNQVHQVSHLNVCFWWRHCNAVKHKRADI